MMDNLALAIDTTTAYPEEDFTLVTNCTAALQAQVMSIAENLNQLEDPAECEEFFTEGSIYSSEDKTDKNGNYIGGVYCVAFGGPTIYIDTITGTVKGYWWTDSCEFALNPAAIDVLNEFFATLFYC